MYSTDERSCPRRSRQHAEGNLAEGNVAALQSANGTLQSLTAATELTSRSQLVIYFNEFNSNEFPIDFCFI